MLLPDEPELELLLELLDDDELLLELLSDEDDDDELELLLELLSDDEPEPDILPSDDTEGELELEPFSEVDSEEAAGSGLLEVLPPPAASLLAGTAVEVD